MRSLFLLSALLTTHFMFAQVKDETAIRNVLSAQTEAWNRGDLTAFMQGYWKSDSLMFIGSSGVTYGWQATLDNYKKGYPDTAAMGRLSFDLIKLQQISSGYFFVVGKWTLQRSIGNLSGHYDLLWRKIKGKWVIVSDHSS